MKNMKQLQQSLLAAASVAALTMGLAAPANALPVRDDVGVDGAVDANNVWAGVGMMFNNGSVCTAQLINARTVVTASHCVDGVAASSYGAEFGGRPIGFGFQVDAFNGILDWIQRGQGVGDWSSNPDLAFFNAIQVQAPFDLETGFNFPGGDIALATLDTPALGLPTYGMLFSPILESTPVSMVGYGGTGVGSGLNQGIDFQRRAGANMLAGLFSQSEFWEAAFAIPGLQLSGPSSTIPLYHVDFDRPDRDPDACFRSGADGPQVLGPNDILCNGPGPTTASTFDFTSAIFASNEIDWFPGDAVEGEAGTLGGDSGSGLFVNIGGQELISGVLSGGWRPGIFTPDESLYADISYYSALFQFQNWLVEQDPMIYASAAAGDGVWSDASRWTRDINPYYYVVDENGQLQNGLWEEAPETPADAFSDDSPRFGTIFDTDVADLASNNPAPTSTVSDSAGTVTQEGLIQVNGDTATSNPAYVGDLLAGGSSGSATSTVTAVEFVDLDATSQSTPPLSLQSTPSTGFRIGDSDFTPNNSYGTYGTFTGAASGQVARFFDVNLSNAGTTTVDMNVEIDRLRLTNTGARFVLPEAYDFISLISFDQSVGESVIDGDLIAREYLLASGMLSGSGTITTMTLWNIAGMVSPGAIGAVGTLTVDGNYVQTAGGGLVVDWNATGADTLNVSGDVALGGAVALNSIGGYVPTFGDSRRIIDFGGDLVGEFAGDNLPGVLYLQYTVGAGFVDATIAAESFSTQTTFQNSAQTSLAEYLDNVRDTSYASLSSVYGSVDLLEGENLSAAMEVLLPHEAFQMRRSAESHLDVFNNQMRDVVLGQASTSGSVGEGAAFTAGLMDADHQAGLQDASLAILAEDAASGPNLREMARGVRVFAAAGQIDGDLQTTASTSSDLDGDYGMVGVDFQTRDWLRLGVTLAYASTEADARPALTSSILSETDTVQLGGYALVEKGNLMGLARVAAASHESDVRRAVSAGASNFDSTGKQDADTLEASALLAYRYNLWESNTYLTPVVSMTWSETEYDASEQASGAAGSVTVLDSISSELVGRLGFNVGTHFTVGEAVIEPRAYFGLADNLRDSSDVVYASFNGAAGAFAVDAGLTEDDEWQEVNLGVLVHLPNDLSLALSYESIEDRGDVLNTETLSVGARFRF